MNIWEIWLVKQGDILYSTQHRNADGTPERWRANGQTKRWKTRPNDFRIPLKRGLREYGYLTQRNMDAFAASESSAEYFLMKQEDAENAHAHNR